jgi:N-acyl-D-aspartate/D-glutamate deacylase
MALYSLIVRGGRLYDGSGSPWFSGDVAVSGDRIEAMGDLKGCKAEKIVDADGLSVAPGFIDIHTHSDTSLLMDARGESHIRQGVTTAVIGNCGGSSAPLTDSESAKMPALFPPGADLHWKTYGEYLTCVEKAGTSMNVAPLVGHGTVRNVVMGYNPAEPNEEQMGQMSALVREAMEDGCFGMSTGLIYTPGCYGGTVEIARLAKVIAEYDGLYFTHIRGENDTLLDAVQEAIEIGRRSKVPVQIAHLKAMGSHMWGKSADVLALIDRARAEGIEVTFDQYPYTASATGLAATLPPWAQAGGREKFLTRLADPAERGRMKRDMEDGVDGWYSLLKGVGWDKIIITNCRETFAIGKSVAEIAQERNKDGFETCFDLLEDNGGLVNIVFFNIGDEDLERILRHPAGMVGSDSSSSAVDGLLHRGKPHPRSFGTFVRVLGHYVRERA